MKTIGDEIYFKESELSRSKLTNEEWCYLCAGINVRMVSVTPKIWAFPDNEKVRAIFTRIGMKEDQ